MPDDDAREDAHKNGDTRVEEEEKESAPQPDDEVAAAVVERFPGTVFHRSHGQPVMYVDRAVWADLGGFLRDEQQFTQCIDVTAVDHLVDAARLSVPGVNPERFELVASFLSHPRNRRIRAICEVPAEDATVPSLTGAYPGANFGEREVYDMFGIAFTDHPDLARILMPDDWVGYPLRRDYPVGGEVVEFSEEHETWQTAPEKA